MIGKLFEAAKPALIWRLRVMNSHLQLWKLRECEVERPLDLSLCDRLRRPL
jgi:hypothetical protein